MGRNIGKCEVCIPIEQLLDELRSQGYEEISGICRDVHFNEVEIKMSKRKQDLKLIAIDIENIEIHDKGFYYCKCHWSSVYVID